MLENTVKMEKAGMSSATNSQERGQWSSRVAFILAATGSAVGLGNIWKFPYITGENGGGAFVLVYLACIAVIGIPIMMAETFIGRRGQQNPVSTMKKLAAESGASKLWSGVGWLGIIAGFIILSFYSVVAGWAIYYVVEMASGTFNSVTPAQTQEIFTGLLKDDKSLLLWHSVFMVMTAFVVSRGVSGGLEKAARLLMPGLFILLMILLAYAYNNGDFSKGIDFLFNADFSKLTGKSVLIALGHSFFTLSLGMGAIMVYGSYLPKNVSVAKTTFSIAFLDTIVALVAGMVIFPIVFASPELSASGGPGLLFQTLPVAFSNMPGGTFFGFIFFILIVFAAWTSAISLLEPAVSWAAENTKLGRTTSTVLISAVIWFVGIGSLLSFNDWSEYKLFGKNFFDLSDFLASNIMLPLGGLLIALFAGYAVTKTVSKEELNLGSKYDLWRFVIRYISPILVLYVFLEVSGINEFIRSTGVWKSLVAAF